MKCMYCDKPMNKAALWVGKMPIGPKCAKKLQEKKAKDSKSVASRDNKTMELFSG